MSATATRRQIRRAFGSEAVDLIETLKTQIEALLAFVQAQDARIKALEAKNGEAHG